MYKTAVKVFKEDKGYGFTTDDKFFHVQAHNIFDMRWMKWFAIPCEIKLEPKVGDKIVLIEEKTHLRTGKKFWTWCYEWEVPPDTPIYIGIKVTTTKTELKPVCDSNRRMYRVETEVLVDSSLEFIGSLEKAREWLENKNPETHYIQATQWNIDGLKVKESFLTMETAAPTNLSLA